MTKVICGFAGIGKSHMLKTGYNCLDLDSSKFDKKEFPKNYVDEIEEIIRQAKVDYLLVSMHKELRCELLSRGIEFTMVYPSLLLKDEYLQRYSERGDDASFIKTMERSWTSFIVDCAEQYCSKRIVLKQGQYLADVIESI